MCQTRTLVFETAETLLVGKVMAGVLLVAQVVGHTPSTSLVYLTHSAQSTLKVFNKVTNFP